MKQLIIATIGDDCSEYLNIYFESIKDTCDKIIFVWGMNEIKTQEILNEWQIKLGDKLVIFKRKFDKSNLNENSNARNFYLDYIKNNFLNDYCLVLDPDEILQYGERIKNIIKHFEENTEKKNFLISPRIRHFVYNLGFEDASLERHYCPNRFFQITNELFYPNGEHTVLNSKENNIEFITTDVFCLWHFREMLGGFNTLNKFKWNISKSNVHTKGTLNWWYNSMIFGSYPVKRINYNEIPYIIKKYFLLEE
jgi:hypothetical protein